MLNFFHHHYQYVYNEGGHERNHMYCISGITKLLTHEFTKLGGNSEFV